jgi:hypothetical protein
MVKKMATLILILILSFQLLLAPGYPVIYITKVKPLTPYDKLIYAICWVESRSGKFVYNGAEQAVGWFQIRQVRVDDYNDKRGTDYKLDDFFDYELSKEMFLFYCEGDNFEKIARCWNGGEKGMKIKQTLKYWNLVKTRL